MMRRLFDNQHVMLAAFVALTVIPLLGNAYLFDWDEVNFAECAREMLVSGDYVHPQIDFEPFWEKPPLFFWLQAASMHVFGVNEFAARFPNALVGIATVVMLSIVGTRWVDRHFGLLWALLWIGSLLPQFYMHSGLIDPLFNLLMVASALTALSGLESPHRLRWLLVSGLLLGCAVLTKGPVALILVGVPLLVVWLTCCSWSQTLRDALIVLLVSIVPFLLWLAADRSDYGTWFIQSFLNYQLRLLRTGDAGHSGPVYYHVVVLLLGCFPASILAFGTVRAQHRIFLLQQQSRLMLAMLVTVVVVFSIVQTKIVHYSSLAYFPITFFAAQALQRRWERVSSILPWIAVGFVLVGIVMVATPLVLSNKELLLRFVRDDFARALIESTQPQWRKIEWIAGAALIVVAVSIVGIARRFPFAAFATLMLASAVSISAFIRMVAPRIQDYTQRPVVELCRSYSRDAVILHPVGFKTYMHLFYGKRRPELSPRGLNVPRDRWEQYLLDGNAPVDVIFIAKRTKAADLLRRGDLVQLSDPASAWLFLLLPAKQGK